MVARKRPIVKSKKRKRAQARASVYVRKKRKKSKKKKRAASGTTKRKKKSKRKKLSKKHLAKKRRSLAAKKGWETRRKQERALKRRMRDRAQANLERHPELVGSRELFGEVVDQREAEAEAETGRLTRSERDRIRREALREYTEALRPIIGIRRAADVAARLRVESRGEAQPDVPGDLEDTEESLIMNRLIIAQDYGYFDDEAYAIAEEYDWDPQEVYGLWYGYLDD